MKQTNPNTTLRGAQPGAQLDQDFSPDMLPTDTAVILRVLDRHGLSQAWCAEQINKEPGYISRVLSGKYPVPHELVRKVFRVTGDAELLELICPRDSTLKLISISRAHLAQCSNDVTRQYLNATQSMASVHHMAPTFLPSGPLLSEPAKHVIKQAIADLLGLINAIDHLASIGATRDTCGPAPAPGTVPLNKVA